MKEPVHRLGFPVYNVYEIMYNVKTCVIYVEDCDEIILYNT